MKKGFRKPIMNVELFVANQAVSTCTVSGGIDYDFDCMYGPTVDTRNVISSSIPNVSGSCSLSIGYASGVSTARDYCKSNMNHSNNNSSRATWTSTNDYLQVTYSGVEGLLYTDGNAQTDASVWSVQNGIVTHSKNSGGMHHMVAPVIDSRTINASW